MLIGLPREIKTHEYRVGLTPASVRELVHHGHDVIVQKDAGHAIGLDDDDYVAAGARIADSPEEIFAAADMIVKVKEPQPAECRMLREGQLLFTYLHLAPDPEQTPASGAASPWHHVIPASGGQSYLPAARPFLRPSTWRAGVRRTRTPPC